MFVSTVVGLLCLSALVAGIGGRARSQYPPQNRYGEPAPPPSYGYPPKPVTGYEPPKTEVGYGPSNTANSYEPESYHETDTHYYKPPPPPPPPPSNKCYQCTWAPKQKYKHTYGKEYYGTQKTYHGEEQYGGRFERTKVGVNQPGWDKCEGPFTYYQAKQYGIDVWDCHYNNCYTRKDANGHIFRGCYKGEYGVDQNLFGCHYQAGSLYCFCKGQLCNNGPAPSTGYP